MKILTICGLALGMLLCSCHSSPDKDSVKPEPERFKLVARVAPEKLLALERMKVFDGRIYANDYQNKIYTFNLDGRLLASCAGQGEGPGEFKYLSDFITLGQQLIAADMMNKVAYFDLSGGFVKETMTPYRQITALLSLENELACVTRVLIARPQGRLRDFYFQVIRLSDGHQLLSLLDDTVQFNQESKLDFPYLVAPYPNRKFFVTTTDNQMAILMAQESTLKVWQDGTFVSVPLALPLSAESITTTDRQDFFDQIKSANTAQVAEEMKRECKFPTQKELFMGAIAWGRHLALLRLDRIIVIDLQGSQIENLPWPKEYKPKSYWEFFYPEKRIQFHDGRLYIMDEDEEALLVFALS